MTKPEITYEIQVNQQNVESHKDRKKATERVVIWLKCGIPFICIRAFWFREFHGSQMIHQTYVHLKVKRVWNVPSWSSPLYKYRIVGTGQKGYGSLEDAAEEAISKAGLIATHLVRWGEKHHGGGEKSE